MNSSDIAKLAGVSRSTVSRVLNNYGDISDKTRQKVEAVIKEYNYVPNSFGQGLVGKPNRIIGLFIVDIDNKSEDNLILSRSEVFYNFIAYASDIAHNLNYNILISIIDPEHMDNIQKLFINKSICGGLIIGDTYDHEIIDSLGRQNYKIALHNQREHSDIPNIINVNVDNVTFAHIATLELLKNGHKKIGLITGSLHKYTVQKRYEGFLQALSEYGLEFDPTYIGIGDFHRESGGYDAVKQLLGKCGSSLPTALLISNSVMLPGALQALKEAGLKIPEDISVIGVGGSAYSAYTDPPITDLVIDSQLIASAMISKMTELLDMKKLQDNNILLTQYELISRQSIKDISGKVTN